MVLMLLSLEEGTSLFLALATLVEKTSAARKSLGPGYVIEALSLLFSSNVPACLFTKLEPIVVMLRL